MVALSITMLLVEKKATWASESCGLVKIGLPPKWVAVTDPAGVRRD